MKKGTIFLLFLFLLLSNQKVYAKEKTEVTLLKCVDGDTAWFKMEKEEIKVRFLAIDTPESTNKKEPFGKEASEFTCEKLKEAKKITLEWDENSEEKDKYDRYLAWIFVDDVLLQNLLVEEGYAEVAYLYGEYKYTSLLKESEILAKKEGKNIWSQKEQINYTLLFLGIFVLLILCIISTKYRKKVTKEIEKYAKKEIKKRIKNL